MSGSNVCLDPNFSTTRLVNVESSLSLPVTSNDFVRSQRFSCDGGLRKKGCFKQAYEKRGDQWYSQGVFGALSGPVDLAVEIAGTYLPLVTVVTVIFNGKPFLEETIQSVINQTYPNVEYIIIDGGSTDGTLDIIHKYEHVIDYWITEKDEGIYDAMNKGINISTGDWINFMNAGDNFFSCDTLMAVFVSNRYKEDIIYGSVQVRYPDFTMIKKTGRLDRLWGGMIFCHQSSFVRTDCHRIKNFNSSNKIAADLEFFYGSYKNGFKFKCKDIVISSVRTGGFSELNPIETIIASKNAVFKYGFSLKFQVYYILLYLYTMLRGWLKKILPKKVIKKMIEITNS